MNKISLHPQSLTHIYYICNCKNTKIIPNIHFNHSKTKPSRMLKLNLPQVELKLEKRNDRICVWDHIRSKWIALTPEEWVRQHFTHWLVKDLGYPRARLGHEVTLQLNGMQRRCDAIYYAPDGHPHVIMEFKAPHVTISQKTFDQISRYNMTMQVPWLIVSNGISHYCAHIDKETNRVEFLKGIPPCSII